MMAFAISKLLLTAARQAQLTTALANATVTAPLETLIAEAEARVDAEIAGLDVATAQRESLVRAFTLQSAYALVGPVPKDITSLYDAALAQLTRLRSIADPSESGGAASAGLYGGDDSVPIRS